MCLADTAIGTRFDKGEYPRRLQVYIKKFPWVLGMSSPATNHSTSNRSAKMRNSKSQKLLETLAPYEKIVVVMHDNPDPDAIAAGWCLHTLIEVKTKQTVSLVGGGGIVRAENQHMVELLHPPLELVDEYEFDASTAPVLVDCGFGKSNHIVSRVGVKPVAIIDHHETCDNCDVLFRDIRPDAAGTCAITASYLLEQNVPPDAKLATAITYAMRTETRGFETHHSDLDRTILSWLNDRYEPSLLAEIESAPLSRDYYADLVLALQNTFVYDDAALCMLPRASGPEIVGEVADLLIRSRGIYRVLCGAAVGDDLLLSARTERASENATTLLQETLDGLGGSGGHSHRAGGKISGAVKAGRISDELADSLRTRWLAACHVNRQRGTRLIARREIVENL